MSIWYMLERGDRVTGHNVTGDMSRMRANGHIVRRTRDQWGEVAMRDVYVDAETYEQAQELARVAFARADREATP